MKIHVGITSSKVLFSKCKPVLARNFSIIVLLSKSCSSNSIVEEPI